MISCKTRLWALAAAALALPSLCLASTTNYTVTLDALNNSGVSGVGTLVLTTGTNIDTLHVTIDAIGLQANETHMAHIHGLTNGDVATCPTMDQDTNGDGYISLVEGAATYGPIKVNLTTPPTAFGPSPLAGAGLATNVSGSPVMTDFPMADATGNIHYDQTITFDLSDPTDAAAFATIDPLVNQHIVIHGMDAPNTVDAGPLGITNPDGSTIYDPLLPVACGEIQAVPEPSAAWIGLSALGCLGGIMVSRRRKTRMA